MTYRCVCGDPREQHRQGRRGCKALDCGCDRYEAVAERAETQRVLTAVAQVCEDQATKARAELAADVAQPPRAELVRAEQERDEARAKARDAEHSRRVAAERYEADLAAAQADVTRLKTHLVGEQARLRGHITTERARREAAEAELKSTRDVLDLARDGRDEAGLPGRVLRAYAAWSCLTDNGCGARYTVAYPDHGCGPLTPVTVTITRDADR